MLILSRNIGQKVIIKVGEEILSVEVVDIRSGNKVKLGFEANREVIIHREEVWEEIQRKIKQGVRPA